jgi:hypothetical protein
MAQLLVWYNLIFYIPLALGILSVVGVAFSGFEHDIGIHVDGAVHGDSDGDGEHDGGGIGKGILSLLGFGKVPVAISIMVVLLTFGGIGVTMNNLLEPLIRHWSGFALGSIACAFVGMFFLSAFISRLIGRVMPSTETDSVTSHDLIGCSGTLILPADSKGGLAQLRNKKGELYQVQCRSDSSIPKSSAILTIDYNASGDFYTVVRDPSLT